MPDFRQFPTGSMGIGPIPSTHRARFMRYLQHRKMLDPRDRKLAPDDDVSAGWAGNPNLYNGVIRPYCTGCHLALGPSRDLAILISRRSRRHDPRPIRRASAKHGHLVGPAKPLQPA